MEHVLVNHMFFEQFRFRIVMRALRRFNIAICAVYALIRVLCVCAMAEQQTDDGVYTRDCGDIPLNRLYWV